MSTQPVTPKKDSFEIALTVAKLINDYGPGLVSLYARIKKDNGEEETVDLLARAREKVNANIARADEALKD
jgi:hypothetical protein